LLVGYDEHVCADGELENMLFGIVMMAPIQNTQTKEIIPANA
jgi:hypothetical protein